MNDAGRIGFLIRGEYSDLETYDFLDIVYYNESSYVAKKTSTGNPPHRNNEFWQMTLGLKRLTHGSRIRQTVKDMLRREPGMQIRFGKLMQMASPDGGRTRIQPMEM